MTNKISRRKFIYLGTGAALATAALQFNDYFSLPLIHADSDYVIPIAEAKTIPDVSNLEEAVYQFEECEEVKFVPDKISPYNKGQAYFSQRLKKDAAYAS